MRTDRKSTDSTALNKMSEKKKQGQVFTSINLQNNKKLRAINERVVENSTQTFNNISKMVMGIILKKVNRTSDI